MIKQGTVSVLFGCHSIVHSVLVLLAWKKLYKKWPEWWQVGCIFLHDIGHWGKDYLDDYEEKKKHWEVGAQVAWRLFGEKGYRFVAGHCGSSSWVIIDEFKKADRYSWYLAPKCWILSNIIIEPELQWSGFSKWESVLEFKKMIEEQTKQGLKQSLHQVYLDRCQK